MAGSTRALVAPCYAAPVLGEMAFGTLVGVLAANGAFRWVGRAILLLVVIGILGYRLVAVVAGASFAIGVAWAVLEARAGGAPARSAGYWRLGWCPDSGRACRRSRIDDV